MFIALFCRIKVFVLLFYCFGFRLLQYVFTFHFSFAIGISVNKYCIGASVHKRKYADTHC